MRVGVLTFHAQCNYGGVLQAWAMRQAIEGLGHEAWVVDRWLDPWNVALLGPFADLRPKAAASWLAHGTLGCGHFGQTIRHWRTIRFMRGTMRLTPYHFLRWEEMAGRDLGIDRLVVGSDQVWHCGDWGDPSVYLLEGAPTDLRAIAYAASFGMREIPPEWRERYRVGLARFETIGVREAEGVALAASVGAHATHVTDPTQLIPEAMWCEALRLRTQPGVRLVCYFLSERIRDALPALETFARRTGAQVEVFLNGPQLACPKSARELGTRLRQWATSPVRLRLGAGPREFVEAMAGATWVVSDSFHALMFASIFGRDVRILRPREPLRQRMFARIEEFAARFAQGPVVAEGLDAALASLSPTPAVSYDAAALAAERVRSLAWLRDALAR